MCFAGQVKIMSLVLQDKCNIEIFLSPGCLSGFSGNSRMDISHALTSLIELHVSSLTWLHKVKAEFENVPIPISVCLENAVCCIYSNALQTNLTMEAYIMNPNQTAPKGAV